jgi:hypothetical protein
MGLTKRGARETSIRRKKLCLLILFLYGVIWTFLNLLWNFRRMVLLVEQEWSICKILSFVLTLNFCRSQRQKKYKQHTKSFKKQSPVKVMLCGQMVNLFFPPFVIDLRPYSVPNSITGGEIE